MLINHTISSSNTVTNITNNGVKYDDNAIGTDEDSRMEVFGRSQLVASNTAIAMLTGTEVHLEPDRGEHLMGGEGAASNLAVAILYLAVRMSLNTSNRNSFHSRTSPWQHCNMYHSSH